MSDTGPAPHLPPGGPGGPATVTRLVVGAAIVDSLGEPRLLLAARRTAPAALAGFWEFPGGKVDPGETAEQALRRELDEELAVVVVLGDEVAPPAPRQHGGDGVVDPDHGPAWRLGAGLVLRLWLAELVGLRAPRLPAPLEDHDELRWLDRDSLQDVPWLPADAAAVAALADLMLPPLRHTGSP